MTTIHLDEQRDRRRCETNKVTQNKMRERQTNKFKLWHACVAAKTRKKKILFAIHSQHTLTHTHTKHALFLSLTHTHMIYLSKTWRCDTREKIDLGQGGVWLLCCSPASRGKKVDNSKSWAALLSSNPPSLPSKNTDSHYFGQSPT